MPERHTDLYMQQGLAFISRPGPARV